MEETFAEFKSIIEHQGFTLEQLGFLPGATEAQVVELEQVVGRSLPSSLRYFLMQVNGQNEDGMLFLPGGACSRLMSCEEIARHWRFEQKMAAKEGAMDYYDRFQDGDRIRSVLNSEGRIVIAEDPGIAMVALDYVQGPSGIPGQMITDVSECDFLVLADSFEAYFAKIVRLMASGTLAIGYSDDFECCILGYAEQLDLVEAEDFIAMPG